MVPRVGGSGRRPVLGPLAREAFDDHRVDARRVHHQHRLRPDRPGRRARIPHHLLLGRGDPARGGGALDRALARWLMEVIHAHPELQGFRRWVLLTRDAHALYRHLGYMPLAAPDRYMERWAK